MTSNFTTSDQKLVDGKLYLTGFMSTSSKDLDGERNIITPNALKLANSKLIGLPIKIEHGFTQKYKLKTVGELLKLEFSPENYQIDSPEVLEMEIKVFVVITDKWAIEDVLNGNLSGFSLRWTMINYLINPKTRQELSTQIEPVELTLTKNPANQDCYFKIISTPEMVKSYLDKVWQYQGQVVKVKSVYKNQFDNLFCDLEFQKEKVKSATKIPVENILPNCKLIFKTKIKIKCKFILKLKNKIKSKFILKSKAVKNPEDLGIDNLGTQELKSIENELLTAINSQLETAKFANEKWSFGSITNFLGNNLKKITDKISSQTMNLYNSFYGTNWENLPENSSQYQDALAKITLEGYQKINEKDYSNQVLDKIKVLRDYEGFDKTTQKTLDNAGQKANLKEIGKSRQTELFENLETNIYHDTVSNLAREDGRNFVGVITSRDKRVRRSHAQNEYKYSEVGANGLNRFSSDLRCRCTYFYGTEAEMIKYEFSKI